MPLTAPRRATNQAAPAQRAPQVVIPFTAAAHEHVEPITTQSGIALGAATLPQGPFDVPAYGFLQHVVLDAVCTGGTTGTAVADAPFTLFQSIALLDVNGAPIFGPMDGWATLMTNVYGNYGGARSDPRLAPGYVGTTPNFSFQLRIPVQISRHNAYGAIANQNAAAAYKLQYTLNTSAAVWSVAPTGSPVWTIRSWVECWSQPAASDILGRAQRREPPGHGTTQFWSSFTKSGLAAGQLNIILPRVGNLIRALVFICRDNSGVRTDATMPDPIQFNWDARILTLESQRYRIFRQGEQLPVSTSRDTGIFVLPFNSISDGQVGDEAPNLWLPTVQASRLELAGVSAGAGSIQVLTNDVAPVEVDPADRFVDTSATGFHAGAAPVTPAVAV